MDKNQASYVGSIEEIVSNATDSDHFEMSGTIKWFDILKGYGFIDSDDGHGDVLLHVSCLRQDGYKTAYKGSRVTCLTVKSNKGYQAVKIKSMDESNAEHPSQLPLPNTAVRVTAVSGMVDATVKWFNITKGFGFVTINGSDKDIFVHVEVLRRYGITELRPGQTVQVRYGHSPKGLLATELRPSTGGHIPYSH